MISNLLGYLLLWIYNLVPNYGIAIILFTLLIKLLMLPLSIVQQKSMKAQQSVQKQVEAIQLKYKNDPEKQNQAVMKLYRDNKINPFSGCLLVVLQFVLIISMFYLVKDPLTKMEKMSEETVNIYIEQLKSSGIDVSVGYPQIDVIREYDFLKQSYPDDPQLDKVDINMNLFGINLTMIPQSNLDDWKMYIIPALYVITLIISNNLTMKMQENMMGSDTADPSIASMNQMNVSMKYIMPIISISIVAVAPLGLALYWLVSNLCMIAERLVLNKIFNK